MKTRNRSNGYLAKCCVTLIFACLTMSVTPAQNDGQNDFKHRFGELANRRAENRLSQEEVERQYLDLAGRASTDDNHGKVFFELACIYANDGMKDPRKTAEYCERALSYPQDATKTCRLRMYWGEAAEKTAPLGKKNEFISVRRKAADIYLQGLALVLERKPETIPPQQPTVTIYDFDGPMEKAEYQELVARHERELAAVREFREWEAIGPYREMFIQKIVSLYQRDPQVTKELSDMARETLADDAVVYELLASCSYLKHDVPQADIEGTVSEPIAKSDRLAGNSGFLDWWLSCLMGIVTPKVGNDARLLDEFFDSWEGKILSLKDYGGKADLENLDMTALETGMLETLRLAEELPQLREAPPSRKLYNWLHEKYLRQHPNSSYAKSLTKLVEEVQDELTTLRQQAVTMGSMAPYVEHERTRLLLLFSIWSMIDADKTITQDVEAKMLSITSEALSSLHESGNSGREHETQARTNTGTALAPSLLLAIGEYVTEAQTNNPMFEHISSQRSFQSLISSYDSYVKDGRVDTEQKAYERFSAALLAFQGQP